MRVPVQLTLVVWALGQALGCSSGSGNPSAGQGSFSCAELCQKEADLQCPVPDPGCEAQCESELAPVLAQCGAEFGAYFGCLSSVGALVCGPGGQAGILNSKKSQCESTFLDAAECSACIPQKDDDACTACYKQACCSELKAFGTAPGVTDYANCAKSCYSQSCIDDCGAQYPAVQQAFDAMMSCQTSKCGSTC